MQGCQGNPDSGKDKDAMSVVGAPATRRHPSHAEKPVTGAALVHSWQAPPRPTPPQAYRPDSGHLLDSTFARHMGSLLGQYLFITWWCVKLTLLRQPSPSPSPAPCLL